VACKLAGPLCVFRSVDICVAVVRLLTGAVVQYGVLLNSVGHFSPGKCLIYMQLIHNNILQPFWKRSIQLEMCIVNWNWSSWPLWVFISLALLFHCIHASTSISISRPLFQGLLLQLHRAQTIFCLACLPFFHPLQLRSSSNVPSSRSAKDEDIENSCY